MAKAAERGEAREEDLRAMEMDLTGKVRYNLLSRFIQSQGIFAV
jgi:hypothetical protein